MRRNRPPIALPYYFGRASRTGVPLAGELETRPKASQKKNKINNLELHIGIKPWAGFWSWLDQNRSQIIRRKFKRFILSHLSCGRRATWRTLLRGEASFCDQNARLSRAVPSGSLLAVTSLFLSIRTCRRQPRYQLVHHFFCIELPDLISDVLKCMSDPQRRVDLRLVRARF